MLQRNYPEGIALFQSALAVDDSDATRLKLGVALMRSGDFDASLAQADRLIAKDASNVEAWKLRGNALASKGDFEHAATALARALSIKGDGPTAYSLAISYMRSKQPEKSRLVFEDMAKNLGDTPSLHILMGHAYRDAGHIPEAIAEYRRALAINPKASHAHYYIGLTTMAADEWDTGDPLIQRELEAEVTVSPDDYLAHYLLGYVAWKKHEYDLAEKELSRATEISPKLPDAWLYLGLLRFDQRDYAHSEPLLRKAIALTGKDDGRNYFQIRRAYFSLGRILSIQQRTEEAAPIFAKARALQSTSLQQSQQHVSKILGDSAGSTMRDAPPTAIQSANTEYDQPSELTPDQQKVAAEQEAYLRTVVGSAYNDRGSAKAHDGQFEAAAADFKEAVRWEPNTPDASRNLGVAAFKLEHFDEAIPALSAQLMANTDDNPVRAMLGLAYFSTGKYREAAAALLPLKAAVNQDPRLAYTLAASLAKSGKSLEAGEVLQQVPTENLPPDVLLLFGQVWADAQNPDRAIALFQRAAQLQPKLPKAHYDAGMAYLRSDRPAEASNEFESELAVNPGDVDAKYNLAFTLIQQNQRERAFPLLKEVVSAEPNHAEAQYQLGKLLLDENNVPDAVMHLEIAAKAAPSKDYIHYQLQSAYRKASRPQDADRELALYKQLKSRGTQ